ncbi:MAG: helix-turn-helix domain-containing protein [Bacteroidetes bacterium]|nr:MAG: helix-turn-helix domain-containing protein [Bacteroidota bacterium]
MYFDSNIKLLRKRKNRTQDEVAGKLGMKRSTLSGYENRVAQPGLDVLLQFSDYYRIAVDTLLKVDLSNLGENQLKQLEQGEDVFLRGGNLRILASTVDSGNRENIELVPLKAQAGYTSGFADPEYISELQVFRLPFLSGQKKYRTFQLKGDSMLPIPEGSWVTGEYVLDWNILKTGEACVVLTMDEGIVFKIVENCIPEEGKLVLYSLNPFYEPYEVDINEIREIWKFVHYISHEIPDPVIPENQLVRTVAALKQDLDRLKLDMAPGISSARNHPQGVIPVSGSSPGTGAGPTGNPLSGSFQT